MDIDPRLAGPRAGSNPSFAAGVGVGVANPTTATPPAHPLGIGGGGRSLGFLPAPHQLTPIQSAPPVFTSLSPLTVSGGSAAALVDQKRPRACESCRGLKVRCEPNETNPFATCKRCAKANRECIFTAPSRKRQKKSDSKVAELEKKIDALTASLNATRAQQARGGAEDDDEEEYVEDGDTPGTIDAGFSPTSRPVKRRRSEDMNSTGDVNIKGDSTLAMYPFLVPKGGKIPTTSHLPPTDKDAHKYVYVDVIDRQLLSMEVASEIFNHYIEDMVPHFPAVIFPPGTTAEDIRRKKPTLFLAILAAASGTGHLDIHRVLYKEISRTFAERVMINGEKSLELVQALLLCTMWYFVPDHFEELKFYMYIHQAAVMALDIGITKKRKVVRGSLRGLPPLPTQRSSVVSLREGGGTSDEEGGKGGQELAPDGDASDKHPPPHPLPPIPPALKVPFPDSGAIESRRTLLACYWTCCNVSMATRRPNLLRYTTFMDECIEVLESSPEAAPTDKTLCQWVKLQKIAEEVGIGFAFDDPNANVSIDDQRVQFTLKGFAKQLEEWKIKCPQEIWQGTKSLELAYNLIMIYTHEIALHRDHNVDDFQPPYTESMMREPSLRPNELLSSCHLDAISRCLSSSHKVIEVFMSMGIQAIRSVPVFTFVRTSYACVILIKLYFSASHPQSELGKVIDKNSLKVGECMDGLLETLKKAADGEGSRQASKFTIILMMLRHWYSKQKAEIERGIAEGIPEPTFKRLGLSESTPIGPSRTNGNENGSGLIEGMEKPRSMDDIPPVDTPDMDRGHHNDMRPPPPRSSPLSVSTPLQMLSNAALESPHPGQYASTPNLGSNIGIATPRSASAAYGKWAPDGGMYTMGHSDSPGTPVMGSGIVQGGHMGYDLNGGGVVYEGGMDYTPQYMFTGNGEMFMDNTFWAMIDEPMNMFDLGGKC